VADVITFRHALALDEYRETFPPTLMHIDIDDDRDFKQVWFPGSHSDLGRMQPHGNGLVNVALRWMIEELDAVGVKFNENALKQLFPHFTRNQAVLSRLNSLEWLESGVCETLTPFWRGGGKKKRVPGWYGLTGKKTNEFIHPSLVMRGWATSQSNRSSIPGHSRHQSPDGTFYYKKTGNWSRNGSWSSDDTRAAMGLDMQDIPEDRFGAFQAFLGGYPTIWWDLGFGSWDACHSG
jgi:hypothetical protein